LEIWRAFYPIEWQKTLRDTSPRYPVCRHSVKDGSTHHPNIRCVVIPSRMGVRTTPISGVSSLRQGCKYASPQYPVCRYSIKDGSTHHPDIWCVVVPSKMGVRTTPISGVSSFHQGCVVLRDCTSPCNWLAQSAERYSSAGASVPTTQKACPHHWMEVGRVISRDATSSYEPMVKPRDIEYQCAD